MGLTLRLVRHGETDWSAERRYTGQADVSLNSDGVEQATALGVVASLSYVSRWTSDLLRCRETAWLMGAAATPTAALREFDFGDMEGKRWGDLDPQTQSGLLAFDGFQAVGGECVAQFAARINAFVSSLDEGHHLLVTHGGVIRQLLRQAGADADVRPGSWRDLDL